MENFKLKEKQKNNEVEKPSTEKFEEVMNELKKVKMENLYLKLKEKDRNENSDKISNDILEENLLLQAEKSELENELQHYKNLQSDELIRSDMDKFKFHFSFIGENIGDCIKCFLEDEEMFYLQNARDHWNKCNKILQNIENDDED